jgi:hypothetical protein
LRQDAATAFGTMPRLVPYQRPARFQFTVNQDRIFCFTFLFGWVWLLFTRNEQREEFGHDIAVVVPVAVNSQARAQINAMRTQREFRTILATTPAYLRLLEEYPESEISVASSAELL